jgi:molybdenum cofactor guanylyltransferase
MIRDLSIAILAGGKSRRMGLDKAFLPLGERPFVSIISEEMMKISSDIVVAVGTKSERRFRSVLDKRVRVVRDSYETGTPVGGLLSSLDYVKNSYSAILACDLPLVMCQIISFLYDRARGHSAAVPIRDEENDNGKHGMIEPLCAVYNVVETKAAALRAIKEGRVSCRDVVACLPDVCYVSLSELKRLDVSLTSLLNVNSKNDYHRVIAETRQVPSSSQTY